MRTLGIPSGTHRVEVRVVSGKSFDDIVGIQGDFRPREQKTLTVSVSPMTKRLKARFDEPAAGSTRP